MQVGPSTSTPYSGKHTQFAGYPGFIGEWKKKQDKEKLRREQTQQIPLQIPLPEPGSYPHEKPSTGDKPEQDGGYNFFA